MIDIEKVTTEHEDTIERTEKVGGRGRRSFLKDEFVEVPETPRLGVELNEEVVREHLREGEELFAPTPEWDEQRSWDRIWS